MKVVVGIPTFRRPKGLRALLDSIAAQRCTFPFAIVIGDNEGEHGAGLAEARAMVAAGYPHAVTLLGVPERGISQVRNALLTTAFDGLGADLLAMVDDDEVVDADWLASLVAMQQQTGADVVGGRVLPTFVGEKPDWADGLSVYWGRERPAGRVEIVDSTNSVLFAAPAYLRQRPRFDHRYSLVGGGDKEYFLRLQGLGAQFAYAPAALSWETYGPTRLTKAWAIKRSFRFGADIRILMRHRRGLRFWAVETGKILVAVPLSLAGLAVFGVLRPRRAMRPALMLVRQLGKISALLGYRYEAYQVTHGE